MQNAINKINNFYLKFSNKIITSYEKDLKLFLIKFFGSIFFLLLIIIIIAVLKPPVAPVDIITELTEYDTVRLTWIDNGKGDRYNIYRSTERMKGFQVVDSTQNLHYFDRGLQPDTIYYYKITSVRKNKESKFSEDVQVATRSVTSPQNVRLVEASNNYIKIEWSGSQTAERFTIYRTEDINLPRVFVGNSNNQSFTDKNLTPNKTYYYYVTQTIKGEETEQSSQLTAKTEIWECGDDILYAGDLYGTVLINNQCWFRENLRYETITGSWCYDDENENCGKYGRLYTFQTAVQGAESEGPQGICPVGWRIPTDEDYRNLEMFLGLSRELSNDFEWRGEDANVGDKLKISTMCTKRGEEFCGSSLFNILLSGYRSTAGAYRYIGTHSYLWTSTKFEDNPIRRMVGIDRGDVQRDTGSINNAHYVRCIKK